MDATSAPLLPRDAAEIATRLRAELALRIVGQGDVVELLLIALLARGHALFQGVPGLAKTLLVRSLAEATSLSFSRIQFTPDLMPGDITGTELLEEDRSTGRRAARFVEGPIFAQVVLADEINRTPPKTQAALLQAMQEHRVSAAGRTLPLPEPFFVLATQNPIEHEGTYALPEAQLDRFMFLVDVDYPSRDDEIEVVRRTTGGDAAPLQPRVSPQELLALQSLVRDVPAGDDVVRFAVDLARSTRPGNGVPDFVRDWVSWGAGPRAGQSLVLAGKARSLLAGRSAVTRDDIRALARPVLSHRVLLNYRAEAEGVRPRDVIDRLVAAASERAPL